MSQSLIIERAIVVFPQPDSPTGFMQYDHEILKPIMSRIADTQLGMTVKLSDDSIWEIFLPNQIRFSKPTLKREGKNGQLELLDLMQRTDLKIVSIF